MKLLDIKKVIVDVAKKQLWYTHLFSAFCISLPVYKSQIILSFLFSLSFFTQALTAEKNFICGYKPVVDYVNSRISLDQRLILHYREKLRKGEITESERVRLTLSLIKYRFLPLQEGKAENCRFYSFLCLQKQSKSLLQIAEAYIQNNPEGPKECYVRQKGSEQTVQFLNSKCELAIKKRVRPIPFPLGIAQAGLESGWGSSYFAKEGMNFFGVQSTLASAQASIQNRNCVPARQNNKKCVYKFDSPENSFFIYSQLLNSSATYANLWDQRYLSEKEGEHPCKTALKMTPGLKAYAEDRKYTNKVQGAIHQVCKTVPNCH